jgi:hypothetical protein
MFRRPAAQRHGKDTDKQHSHAAADCGQAKCGKCRNKTRDRTRRRLYMSEAA